VASAWGTSWGTNWLNSWGDAGAVTPAQPSNRRLGAIDPAVARRLDREAEQRERDRERQDRERREAIELAFRIANGELPEEPAPAAQEMSPGPEWDAQQLLAALERQRLVQMDEEDIELLILMAA